MTLFFTTVVGIYLTILIANMGGYVDKIMKAEIRENTTMAFMSNKGFQKMSPTTRADFWKPPSPRKKTAWG